MAITSGNAEVDRLLARRQASVPKISPVGDTGFGSVTQGARTPANPMTRDTLFSGPGAVVATGLAGAGLGGAVGEGALTSPPAPVSGGGGGVGAGAPSVVPPVDAAEPVEGAAGTAEAPIDSFAGFTEADIAAALAQIEAEFGLTREELLRDQTMIGAQYRLLTGQLARQRQLALEGAEAGALQRGLFRSGIYAEEVGSVAQTFAEQQASLAQQQAGQEGALASEIATLESRKAAEQAAAAGAIRRQEYEARLSAAGI